MDEIRSNKPEELLDKLVLISKEIKKSIDLNSINHFENEFCKVFGQLLLLSNTENFFWIFCPISIYQSTFEDRQKEFLSRYSEASKKDFVKSERENTKNSIKNRILNFSWEIWIQWDNSGWKKNNHVELPLDFLSPETVDNIKFSRKKKLDFLNELLKEIVKEPEKSKDSSGVEQIGNVEQNLYPRIFLDRKSFDLFEYWHKQVTQSTKLAEYSFIYWAMVKDGFIYEKVRPQEFIDFLNDEFEIALSEIKQYNICKGGGKVSKYSTAKLLFKP